MINRYQPRDGLQKQFFVIKQWTSQLQDCLPLLLLHDWGFDWDMSLEIICQFSNFFVTIPLTELILLSQCYYVVKVIIRNQTFPWQRLSGILPNFYLAQLSVQALLLCSWTLLLPSSQLLLCPCFQNCELSKFNKARPTLLSS